MSEQQPDPTLTPAYKPEVPDRTPRPSKVIAEPATPETCKADYDDAADVRRRLGWS